MLHMLSHNYTLLLPLNINILSVTYRLECDAILRQIPQVIACLRKNRLIRGTPSRRSDVTTEQVPCNMKLVTEV